MLNVLKGQGEGRKGGLLKNITNKTMFSGAAEIPPKITLESIITPATVELADLVPVSTLSELHRNWREVRKRVGLESIPLIFAHCPTFLLIYNVEHIVHYWVE